MICVNDEIIELLGDEKEAFLKDRKEINKRIDAEEKTKEATRKSLLSKLESLGLTEAEIASIL